MVSHIAIILARGGSKRLPRKNILDFHGKPMLAWTIEAAIDSGCFSRVIVSTDDKEIATIAQKYKAEVPFLRASGFDDVAQSSEATIIALRQAEEYWGERYEYVSQLMANCPLRNKFDIRESVTNFIKSKTQFQISCFRFGWMNPWWAAQLDESFKPQYLFSEAQIKRSQDLPHLYAPSGAIWIAKSKSLLNQASFYGSNHTFYPLNWMSAMDIDDADDFAMAQACFLAKMSAA